ncbi:hypothetical protein QTP88_005139 [Uroleucon formosanum]
MHAFIVRVVSGGSELWRPEPLTLSCLNCLIGTPAEESVSTKRLAWNHTVETYSRILMGYRQIMYLNVRTIKLKILKCLGLYMKIKIISVN